MCVCVDYIYGSSLVAQGVKNLPAMQETRVRSLGPIPGSNLWVRSLGREDPLEEGMATLSRILAWRIPRTEEPGGIQSMGQGWVQVDGGPQEAPARKA